MLFRPKRFYAVQAVNLGRRALSAAADAGLKGSECLGADALLQLLKNYSRNADIKVGAEA